MYGKAPRPFHTHQKCDSRFNKGICALKGFLCRLTNWTWLTCDCIDLHMKVLTNLFPQLFNCPVENLSRIYGINTFVSEANFQSPPIVGSMIFKCPSPEETSLLKVSRSCLLLLTCNTFLSGDKPNSRAAHLPQQMFSNLLSVLKHGANSCRQCISGACTIKSVHFPHYQMAASYDSCNFVDSTHLKYLFNKPLLATITDLKVQS